MASVLVGYDASPSSAAAIGVAARLLPDASATIAHLWTAPFADGELRRRLWRRASSVEDMITLIEREGAAQAERVAADGVALARAAGWDAAPLVRRCFGGEGFELARLAEERRPDVLILGSRGLGGVRALLGSTSDVAVHASVVPVLVVPHPLLADEREATASGPVVIGYDGSAGARRALATAVPLLAGRSLVVVTVSTSGAEAVEHGVLRTAGAPEAEVAVVDGSGDGEREIAGALARCAAERRAALVAVGSRGRTAAREILLGSVAVGVLHQAHRPVLVVPGERRD